MQIWSSDLRNRHISGPTFLTIGNFDGIHLGHQALLRQLQKEAAAHSPPAKTALLTFDPHPLAVLRPDVPLQLLTTPQERVQLIAPLGLDLAIIQPFDPEFAQLSPAQFMQILSQRLGLARLVVGPDFALGRERTGTLDVLGSLGAQLGYDISVIEPVASPSGEVRSHTIRQFLLGGQVEDAAQMLGRAYSILGTVEAGDGRGRTIGIPTANIRPIPQRLIPANGVYASRVLLPGDPTATPRPSVTNIGLRPTVDGSERRVETHLLDFPSPGESGDLYGQEIELALIARLRDEQRFDGLDALVAQIHRDIAAARSALVVRSQP